MPFAHDPEPAVGLRDVREVARREVAEQPPGERLAGRAVERTQELARRPDARARRIERLERRVERAPAARSLPDPRVGEQRDRRAAPVDAFEDEGLVDACALLLERPTGSAAAPPTETVVDGVPGLERRLQTRAGTEDLLVVGREPFR